MAAEWDIGRAEQDELAVASHHNLAAAYERGFLDDLVTPYLGLERDQNLRPDSTPEKLAKLKPVFGGAEGTMTAANSTPLSDGASAVLLASEEWAAERDLPVLAYVRRRPDRGGRPRPQARRAADGARLRDAADARPHRPQPAGLRLYEIHEAFAAQVLCTLKRLGGPGASAASGSAATSRSARSTAPSSTSTAARSPPATRSPRPAGGSSPGSPRQLHERRLGPRRDQHLRRRRPGRRRDPRRTGGECR